MLDVDFFWSVRSPCCYLVVPRLHALATDFDVTIKVRPVYPHAVRDRRLAAGRGELWISYFRTDILRTAEFLGLPIGWPRPDPVAIDAATGEALDMSAQTLLRDITHRVEAAARNGVCMDYVAELANVMWNPAAPEWTALGILDDVARRSGLSPEELNAQVTSECDSLETAIEQNSVAATEAGHWGVPLMVFRSEPFFGQDRFDQLVWRLRQAGLTRRSREA